MGGRHTSSGDEPAAPRIIADRFVVRDPVPGRSDAWRADDRATHDVCALLDIGPLDAGAVVSRALVVRRLELAPPHATRYLDCVPTDGRLYVARTDVEGTTLAARLRERGPMSADDALHVAVRVLEAAAFLHERGLSVGGFRPEDIVLVPRPGRRDRVVLVEWRGPRSPDPGSLPSQCDARAIADDVYSLGELLLAALGAPTMVERPHDADERADVLEALSARLPVPIARVVHRCLRRNPDERPPNAIAVLRALARRVSTTDHRPTEPHPGSPQPLSRDRSAPVVEHASTSFAVQPRRPPWLLPGAIVAGLMLVTAGGLAFVSSTPTPAQAGLPRAHAGSLRSPRVLLAFPSPAAVGRPSASTDGPQPGPRSAPRKRARAHPSETAPEASSPAPAPVSATAPAVIGGTGSKPDRSVLLPMDVPTRRGGEALLPVQP